MTKMQRLKLRIIGVTCILAGLLLMASLAYADTEDRAQNAAIGDVASSVVGIAAGAAESNPLGLLLIPIKIATLEYAKGLPDGEREYTQSQISSIWGGATVSNICTIGVLLSGGATAIPCLVLGIGYGLHDWQSTAVEREFWAICADERARNPALQCNYRPAS